MGDSSADLGPPPSGRRLKTANRGRQGNYLQEQIAKEMRRLAVEKETLRKDNERLRAELSVKAAPAYGSSAASNSRVALLSRGVEKKKEVLTRLQRDLETETKRLRYLEYEADRHHRRVATDRGDPKLKKSSGPPPRGRSDDGSVAAPYSPSAMSSAGGDASADFITVRATADAHQRVDRQIQVLESRLESALLKFNEALFANKQLREQIDNLRRERSVFDAIYTRLERELQEKKKEMAFVIEVSNVAYEEKDSAITELDQLRMYAKKEMTSFQETFAELDELLEEDRKMKDALRTKMAETRAKIAEGKAAERQRQEQSQQQKEQQKEQANTDGGLTLAVYEETFLKIRTAARCHDVSQLVSAFVHCEDDNFSLFNYVSALHAEIDESEKERDDLALQIAAAKAGQLARTADEGSAERRKELRRLESELREVESRSQSYQGALDATGAVLVDLFTLIEVAFTRLDCRTDRIAELCGGAREGGTPAVTSESVCLFLGALEERTDELLQGWRRLMAKDSGVMGPLLRGPTHPGGEGVPPPEVPEAAGADDFAEGEDDDGVRVLTREELVARCDRRLRQQQLNQEKQRHGKGWGGKKGGRQGR
eukprot:TRINITY_DN9688_c0_g1_i1.p1 TRINITY_DN9688_c0_g1~~TRINITY_DN9688_c0_g1_i1.p1  ORF type:complete len:600 (+),score=171.62 TRINITY_DN9688_c0_g1_i1:79-1878(+)